MDQYFQISFRHGTRKFFVLNLQKPATYEAKNSTTSAIIYKCYTRAWISLHIFRNKNHIVFKPTQKMKLNPLKTKRMCYKGCPNKSARFKVRAIVVLLGWRHWKFNICHLSLLRLVVMERYTKEHCVIIVKTHFMWNDTACNGVPSDAMAIRIGHRDRAIWHHASSFFGGLWNLVSMPTNHKQFLSSRRRFDVSLAKLSRNYAEMSLRISSKE